MDAANRVISLLYGQSLEQNLELLENAKSPRNTTKLITQISGVLGKFLIQDNHINQV